MTASLVVSALISGSDSDVPNSLWSRFIGRASEQRLFNNYSRSTFLDLRWLVVPLMCTFVCIKMSKKSALYNIFVATTEHHVKHASLLGSFPQRSS